METLDNLPVLSFESGAAWEDWLALHHAGQRGVWLKIAKKGAGPSVSYAEALEGALCYGWIDGQKRPYDEAYWLQRFTPRRPRSAWSRINTDKAQQLIDAGRMRPPGQREVDAAQSDGRWNAAYAGQSTMAVPPDLQAELDKHPAAAAFFRTLSSVNRYAILYRIAAARRPETRKKRIETFVAMLLEGQTLYPGR